MLRTRVESLDQENGQFSRDTQIIDEMELYLRWKVLRRKYNLEVRTRLCVDENALQQQDTASLASLNESISRMSKLEAIASEIIDATCYLEVMNSEQCFVDVVKFFRARLRSHRVQRFELERIYNIRCFKKTKLSEVKRDVLRSDRSASDKRAACCAEMREFSHECAEILSSMDSMNPEQISKLSAETTEAITHNRACLVERFQSLQKEIKDGSHRLDHIVEQNGMNSEMKLRTDLIKERVKIMMSWKPMTELQTAEYDEVESLATYLIGATKTIDDTTIVESTLLKADILRNSLPLYVHFPPLADLSVSSQEDNMQYIGRHMNRLAMRERMERLLDVSSGLFDAACNLSEAEDVLVEDVADENSSALAESSKELVEENASTLPPLLIKDKVEEMSDERTEASARADAARTSTEAIVACAPDVARHRVRAEAREEAILRREGEAANVEVKALRLSMPNVVNEEGAFTTLFRGWSSSSSTAPRPHLLSRHSDSPHTSSSSTLYTQALRSPALRLATSPRRAARTAAASRPTQRTAVLRRRMLGRRTRRRRESPQAFSFKPSP